MTKVALERYVFKCRGEFIIYSSQLFSVKILKARECLREPELLRRIVLEGRRKITKLDVHGMTLHSKVDWEGIFLS